jgi:uncharacterized protein (DUF488 family)
MVRVADVRRFPVSRRHPQFSREPLHRELGGSGIEYVHLGENLGGYRQVTYEEYVGTVAFLHGLQALERLAREGPTAFMCAEKLPWQCHRRFIAQELIRRGWQVIHILDQNTVWDPEQPLLSNPENV